MHSYYNVLLDYLYRSGILSTFTQHTQISRVEPERCVNRDGKARDCGHVVLGGCVGLLFDDRSEACFACQHPLVGLAGFLQRVGFSHRFDVSKGAEFEGIL